MTPWLPDEERLQAVEARGRELYECDACFALYGSRRAAERCAEEDDRTTPRD